MRGRPLRAPIAAADNEGMNGINFGGFLFTNPVPLGFALLARDPGLFAIQVRNMSFGPLPFEPIFFGASALLAGERLAEHDAHGRWRQHPLAAAGLYVSSIPLRYEAAAYRHESTARLTEQYLRIDRAVAARRAQAQEVAALQPDGDATRREGPLA